MINKRVASEIAVGIILLLAVVIGGMFWLQSKKTKQPQPIATPSQTPQVATKNIAIENASTYKRFSYSAFQADDKGKKTENFFLADLSGNNQNILKIEHGGDLTDYDVARNNGRIAYKIDGDGLDKAELWSAGIGTDKKKLAIIVDKKMQQSAWGPIIDDNGKTIVYTVMDYKNNKSEVWKIDFDGKNKQLVKTFDADGKYGCNLYNQFMTPEFFSANGKTAYLDVIGDYYDIDSEKTTGADQADASRKAERCLLSLNVENGNLSKLEIPSFANRYRISFSDDKSKIVVQTAKRDWFEGSYNGFGILDLNSGKFEKVFQSDNLVDFFGAKFSDDDKKLAYSAKENGSEMENLYVYNLESKTNSVVYKSGSEVFVKFYIGNQIVYTNRAYGSDLSKINDDGTSNQSFSKISLTKDESLSILGHLIK